MNELSITESADLQKLESVVARTQEAAHEFYEALKEIRDRKLFRVLFNSFSDYCEARWGKSSRAVNLAIEADQIRKQIPGTTGSPITRNTALALKNVKPNLRPKVLKRAKKLAGPKPISPKHISLAARPEVTIQNIANTGIYSSTPKEQRAPPPPLPLATHQNPLPLNSAQESAIQLWSADDRLWSTQETVAFNLRTFARLILQSA